MRKRTVIVISVLCVYLCAMSASFLLMFNGKYEKRDYKYDSRYSSVEYFSIHSTGGISGDYDDLVNFSTGCHEAFESTASRIALAGALDKNNEEIAGLLEDYQQIRVGSQIMYYQVQTTEEYIYVGLVDTDTNSYYCTCVSNVEKARKKTLMMYTDMTGMRQNAYMISLD